MNPQDDQALRTQLRASLQPSASHDADDLQERVLAQWRQRHPAAAPELAGSHGATVRGGHAGHGARWWLAGSLVLVVALALVWLNRPDPVLEELSQPDVLSQIGLGEL